MLARLFILRKEVFAVKVLIRYALERVTICALDPSNVFLMHWINLSANGSPVQICCKSSFP